MRLLLDTHVFLWLVWERKLSERARSAFLDLNNDLFLSAASYWEICIKVGAGRLQLTAGWQTRFDEEITANEIEWLPIESEHCQRVVALPRIHGDPFDRLLIAQTLCEEMTLLTANAHIVRYEVPTLW